MEKTGQKKVPPFFMAPVAPSFNDLIIATRTAISFARQAISLLQISDGERTYGHIRAPYPFNLHNCSTASCNNGSSHSCRGIDDTGLNCHDQYRGKTQYSLLCLVHRHFLHERRTPRPAPGIYREHGRCCVRPGRGTVRDRLLRIQQRQRADHPGRRLPLIRNNIEHAVLCAGDNGSGRVWHHPVHDIVGHCNEKFPDPR